MVLLGIRTALKEDLACAVASCSLTELSVHAELKCELTTTVGDEPKASNPITDEPMGLMHNSFSI